tara:strand:+ start:273 stop:836 length:564 start_codon:yes stop_codon:yes gene_type:complete
MKKIPTKISGLLILEPTVFSDDRGYFFESFRQDALPASIKDFVQDNESFSCKGTLRGLHFQAPPFSQSKLVRVTSGSVCDIAVDLRYGSSTYGKWHAELLSEKNKRQFLIPEGFAHGFITLENNTRFQYKCTNYYSRESEGGIIYNDQNLNINWSKLSGLRESEFIISEKDTQLSNMNNFKSPFQFK